MAAAQDCTWLNRKSWPGERSSSIVSAAPCSDSTAEPLNKSVLTSLNMRKRGQVHLCKNLWAGPYRQ